MTAPPPFLSLTIPNRIEALSGGMDAVEAYLAAWSVDPGDSAQVMMILDEIASNIIKCAWPDGGEHSFRIELHVAAVPPALALRLMATDDGIAFDPTQVAPPSLDLDLDEREPGGLGLFMVGQMSDFMEYRRLEGCNRLEVRKRLGVG
jgi:anti-sigma regulatory factor (Ser/Thr protein kinase)